MFGNCFHFSELNWKNEVSTIEQKVEAHQLLLLEHDKKKDFFVRTSLPPVEGVFFDGQIFDAYVFAFSRMSDLLLL